MKNRSWRSCHCQKIMSGEQIPLVQGQSAIFTAVWDLGTADSIDTARSRLFQSCSANLGWK